MNTLRLAQSLVVLVLLLTVARVNGDDDRPVKVFILAGQSNMEGKAKVSLLEHQITAPATARLFAHLHKDGEFIERDDVSIKFLDRSGPLTVGYGSPKSIGPELPFVIGVLGVGGPEETDARPNPKKEAFKKAQAAAADLPEFDGNVAVVQTDQFWDMEADAVFKKGWKENFEEWQKIGSDRPYHYLGSVKCYSRIGGALAKALLELQKN